MALSPESIQIIRELNPWWRSPPVVRPEPPAYRRPRTIELRNRLVRPKGLIEVVVGPRQVGKTTAIYQIIQDMIGTGVAPSDLLLVRFDLEVLREEPAALRAILAWYVEAVRARPLERGTPTYLFLDEVHKLRKWSDEIKHVGDTYPLRIFLTGSSSVLVARGGRESLAGRVFTSEMPPFSFREVLDCWSPEIARRLPPAMRFESAFESENLRASTEAIESLDRLVRQEIQGLLEHYYNRGGYPRLHGGEVDDDRWADYLQQTVFENVLGADIPDLFPVENPALLRHLYLEVARSTGNEISQGSLAEDLTVAGMRSNQPTVGKYLHYLADAQLIREFRRYPLAKKRSARVPAKITITDLGVRNAIFRGAPSLWESDPNVVGPLVETMVQAVIRDHGLHVHFFRDYEDPKNRRSKLVEVDFVAERLDGAVLPIEVKFRRKIDSEDIAGLRHFLDRFKTSPYAVLVTRDQNRWDPAKRILSVPLHSFLLAF